MKNSKNIVLVVALVLSMFSVIVSFLNKSSKIGYIYLDEVLSEYHAFQDYNTRLNAQELEFKELLDVYYIDIQEKVEYLKKNKNELKEPEIVKAKNKIKDLERTHREMSIISKQQLDSIKTSWIDPLYKNINDEIKVFSEENGFDYIFGNLGNGNIMYGKNSYNVTLDIIDRINVTYNRDDY